MEPPVTFTSEAKTRLLALLWEAQGADPFVLVDWYSHTGDISRGPNGETNIDRTPEHGIVTVLSGLAAPSEMIVSIDDLPVWVQVRDWRVVLRVSIKEDQLVVERDAA